MTETVKNFTVSWINKQTIRCHWVGLDGDDSGMAVDLSGFPDKTAQITGTIGTGPPTITLYGSNDPRVIVDRAAGTLFGSKTADWVKAQDSLGNDFAKTTLGGDVIVDQYQWYCPVVTGGTSTLVDIIIVATRSPK